MHESVVSRQIVILIRTARRGGDQELIRGVLGQGTQLGGGKAYLDKGQAVARVDITIIF